MRDMDSNLSLEGLYENFQKKYQKLRSLSDTQSKEEKNKLLSDAINEGKTIEKLVKEFSLFSPNEDISEMETKYIKYLCIPGLLGNLINLNFDDRFNSIIESINYYKLFFNSLINYNVFDKEIVKRIRFVLDGKSNEDLFKNRDDKIRMYKESKNIQQKLQIMKTKMNNSQKDVNDNIYDNSEHEETIREIYISELRLLLEECISSYISSFNELKLIKNGTHKEPPPITKKVQDNGNNDFIFLRLDKMNQVFGMGYPSQPTMSQEEYLQYEISTGKIVKNYASTKSSKSSESSDEDENDSKIEKKRQWDEYKDDNRRGSGNTYNRG